MKAMALKSYGLEADFELADVPKPKVKAGRVQIEVTATSCEYD